MHAFFATRGNKPDIDEVIKWLETRTFIMPYKDKDGKDCHDYLTGIIQPIQLWSYVFPVEAKDVVLTSLKFDNGNINRWQNPKMKLQVEALRLMLGAKQIPTFSREKVMPMPIDSMRNVSIIPIGVKYDAQHTCNGQTYEAL